MLAAVGDLVRAERERRNLSQRELAKLAKVSRKHLSDFEGGANVSLEVLVRITSALGLKKINVGTVTIHAQDEAFDLPVPIASFRDQLQRVVADTSAVLDALKRRSEPGREKLASVTPIDERRKIARKSIFEMSEEELRAAGVPFSIPKYVHPLEGQMVDVWGYVAAGPHGFEEIPPGSEKVFVPNELLPQGDEKILIARGESMIDFGIKDRDVVIVKPRKGGVAAKGEIIIAWYNDGCVIKEFQRREGKKLLVSHNPNVPPIELKPDDIYELQAVVRRWFSAPSWQINFAPKVSG